MKKISLVMILALALVIAFAATAFAAVDVIGPLQSSITGDATAGAKGTTVDEAYGADRASLEEQNFANGTVKDDDFYLPWEGATSKDTRIHSNYKENTDACAACHFTHTATGPRLLQWGSIFKACAACHDGSLGTHTYDVFAGYIGTETTTGVRTFGGLFGGAADMDTTGNTTSLSTHMPNGYMALSAAPGAATNVSMEDVAFDCASCHTPHGQGGNARILSPDPGKMKISSFFTDSTSDASAKSALLNTEAYKVQLELDVDGNYQDPDAQNWIQGYPYNKVTAIIVANTEPTLTFDATTNPGVTANVGSVVGAAYLDINYRTGTVTLKPGAPAGIEVWAVRVPGIFVAMKIDDYMGADEDVTYLAAETTGNDNKWSEGINAYCGACHGLYNTQGTKAAAAYDFFNTTDENHGSGSNMYDGAYRHQVGFTWNNQWTGQANFVKFAYPLTDAATGEYDETTKIFTCLSCHFAHGTNQTYWDAYVGTANVTTYSGSETFGSSALKRLPNMGICESCHDKKSGNNKVGTYY